MFCKMQIEQKNNSLLVCYLLLIIIICLFSCKNDYKKIVAMNRNGTPGLVYEYANKNDTANFKVKIYYPDGRLQKEGAVVNGKYVGEIITYFHNGKIYEMDSLSEPCDIDSSPCTGALSRYNENGTISQRFSVIHRHVSGLSQNYDGKGILVKEYYLTQDSIKNGEYREYYDNGKLLYKAIYKNDTVIGYSYFFKENGDTLKYFLNYKGAMDLPYKKWLDNGDILTGNFLDKTKQKAVWKWYDKNGKEVKRKIVYQTKEGFISPEKSF